MEAILPQNLKGYEIRERIGAGGFGVVYRAYQSTVGREVAIKIILPGLANQPEFIRRFQGEVQIIARLEHPTLLHSTTIGATLRGRIWSCAGCAAAVCGMLCKTEPTTFAPPHCCSIRWRVRLMRQGREIVFRSLLGFLLFQVLSTTCCASLTRIFAQQFELR